MELGERLKKARLEAGMSQRQLCGEEITRNMLSQIEHGTAKPSVSTLRYLAARLGKPTGYFLEEQAVTSPNQQIMEQARNTDGEEVLELLRQYRAPDPVFDRERWLLEALTCMKLAETALAEGKTGYAWSLLEQAQDAGSRTPYYTRALQRQRLLLCYQVRPEKAAELKAQLPAEDGICMMLAHAALQEGNPDSCGRLLDAVPRENARWHYLRGEVYFLKKQYPQAVTCYRKAEAELPEQVCPRLEICYREMEDYRMAYLYACRQRDTLQK